MKYFLSTNCVSELLVHFLLNDQELGQTLLQKVEPACQNFQMLDLYRTTESL